jgi:hypothetical protein
MIDLVRITVSGSSISSDMASISGPGLQPVIEFKSRTMTVRIKGIHQIFINNEQNIHMPMLKLYIRCFDIIIYDKYFLFRILTRMQTLKSHWNLQNLYQEPLLESL